MGKIKWGAKLKLGRTFIQDDELSGFPDSRTTAYKIVKILSAILKGRRVKIRELLSLQSISSTTLEINIWE